MIYPAVIPNHSPLSSLPPYLSPFPFPLPIHKFTTNAIHPSNPASIIPSSIINHQFSLSSPLLSSPLLSSPLTRNLIPQSNFHDLSSFHLVLSHLNSSHLIPPLLISPLPIISNTNLKRYKNILRFPEVCSFVSCILSDERGDEDDEDLGSWHFSQHSSDIFLNANFG